MTTNRRTAIIKEIYDGDNSPETFEEELDRALERGCEIIIIEPTRLAEETARWIIVGNYLHKVAVVSGLSSICINITFYRNYFTISIPLTVVSVFCAGLYMISWQFDPCCKYQISTRLKKLSASDSEQLSPEDLYYSLLETTMDSNSTTPLILVRKSDTRRKILHTAVAILAFTLTIFRIYK